MATDQYVATLEFLARVLLRIKYAAMALNATAAMTPIAMPAFPPAERPPPPEDGDPVDAVSGLYKVSEAS